MPEAKIAAAVRGETDAYDVGRERLLGRHAAGHGYLRAAVAAAGGAPIVGYGPSREGSRSFSAIVRGIDPNAQVGWVSTDDPAGLARCGVLYLADPILTPPARLRLRAGVGAYSLCGVTHTTATTSAMDHIAGLLREPVAPWDALICTSSAVLETVRMVHEAESSYLRWRFGPEAVISCPQLPVIPLGVHTADFAFTDATRASARLELAVEPDEVVALYVGRYASHGKAHPLAMFQGLEAAARRSGRRMVAVLCGWAPSPELDAMFRGAAAEFAPNVRTLFLDGRKADERTRAWAGADIFVSLVDGIQETFGLTPIEAKAAGLPVVCTDWNGYRDTVRDGVDGFRIRTWAPGAGMGAPIARAFEADILPYDHYAWAAAASTSVDMDHLVDRLAELAANPDLRRSLGAAGRQDAKARFEWSKVYADYQDLWAELTERRQAALRNEAELAWLRRAPAVNPARLDPFTAFGHYPTARIDAATRMQRVAGMTREALAALADHGLFSSGVVPPSTLLAVWDVLDGAASVEDAARRAGLNLALTVRAVGMLAKMGAVRLGQASAAR